MHPFSIERLTSDEPRKRAVFPVSMLGGAVVRRGPPGCLGLPASPSPPGYVALPAPTSPPGTRGTGSTPCSPDSSFESGYSEPRQGTPPLSPAHSDDSGRGTPELAAEKGPAFTTEKGTVSTEKGSASTEEDSAFTTESHLNQQEGQTERKAGSENEKPPHSYIALISMAILSLPEKKMVLSDIYQYIMDNYVFYRNEDRAWRNSIRHNLSLNECFIKAGRAENGKGNYWGIHPACVDDFAKGDFRRRQARRRARSSGMEPALASLQMAYRYNLGAYVPMAPGSLGGLGYHPYMPHPTLPYLPSGFYPSIPPTSPLGSPPAISLASSVMRTPTEGADSPPPSTPPASPSSSTRASLRYAPYTFPHHPAWQMHREHEFHFI